MGGIFSDTINILIYFLYIHHFKAYRLSYKIQYITNMGVVTYLVYL